jgi:hypothetical protein
MGRKKLNAFSTNALNPSTEPLPPALASENRNGFVRLVESEAFARAVDRVPADYWERPDAELQVMAEPSRVDYALKCALWNEVRRASADPTSEKRIAAREIFGGICSEGFFYGHVLANPAKVAWLLSPIREYEKMIYPLLYCWIERQWEILNLPLTDKKGRVMASVGKLIVQVGKQIEDRALGMPVDRKAHLHAGLGAGNTPAALGAPESEDTAALTKRMAQIDQRLKELESEERDALHLPPAEKVT